MGTAATLKPIESKPGVPEIWKNACLFLAGVVITLAGVWFTHVQNAISRSEAADMIATQGPYVTDKSGIAAKLDTLQKSVDELKSDVRQMTEKRAR